MYKCMYIYIIIYIYIYTLRGVLLLQAVVQGAVGRGVISPNSWKKYRFLFPNARVYTCYLLASFFAPAPQGAVVVPSKVLFGYRAVWEVLLEGVGGSASRVFGWRESVEAVEDAVGCCWRVLLEDVFGSAWVVASAVLVLNCKEFPLSWIFRESSFYVQSYNTVIISKLGLCGVYADVMKRINQIPFQKASTHHLIGHVMISGV